MSRPFPPASIEYEGIVELRPIEPSDIPQVQEALLASLPSLRRYMAWAHMPLSREKLLERILKQHAHYFTGEEYELGLFDKKNGEFILYTGFYPVNRINPYCLEIGYWTSSKYEGKGFATLATKLQIALLFEYFKSDRIEITCNIANHASLRVIEKCGFRYDGNLRNFYPKPTPQMHKDGFIEERSAGLFSLIPEDRPLLEWYPSILEATTLHFLLDPPFKLSKKAHSQ